MRSIWFSLLTLPVFLWSACTSRAQCTNGQDDALCTQILGQPGTCQESLCVTRAETGSSSGIGSSSGSSGVASSSSGGSSGAASSSGGSSGVASSSGGSSGQPVECVWKVEKGHFEQKDATDVGVDAIATLRPPKDSGEWAIDVNFNESSTDAVILVRTENDVLIQCEKGRCVDATNGSGIETGGRVTIWRTDAAIRVFGPDEVRADAGNEPVHIAVKGGTIMLCARERCSDFAPDIRSWCDTTQVSLPTQLDASATSADATNVSNP